MLQDQVDQFSVFYENEREFRGLVREIFRDNTYYFELDPAFAPVDDKDVDGQKATAGKPVILDLGAHIGLSTLYFKKLYPQAKIFAVEPNPHAFEILKTNIEVNHLEDVMVLPVAVSDQTGKRELFLDSTKDKWHSTASFSQKAWDGSDEDNESVQVETVRLQDLVHGPIDFLKLDVEGAEQDILMSSTEALEKINHIIFEYHPVSGNNLQELGHFLKDNDFKVSVYKHGDEIPLDKSRGLVLVEAVKNF